MYSLTGVYSYEGECVHYNIRKFFFWEGAWPVFVFLGERVVSADMFGVTSCSIAIVLVLWKGLWGEVHQLGGRGEHTPFPLLIKSVNVQAV